MKAWLALAGILAMGVWLRFQGLGGQSMLHWDEGLFTTGARFLAWRFHQPQALPEQYEGYPVFNEKPLHVLLLAGVSELFGHQPATGRFLSAVFSLATLGLLAFRLLRFGVWAALAGVLTLSCSVYHTYYSRLGLHEIDSVFWLFLGATLLDAPRRSGWRSGLAGVCAGLCLGTSYRWLPVLPILGLLCVEDWRRPWKSWLPFGIGGLAVLLGCEALYHWTFFPDFTAYQPASYWEAMRSKFTRESHFTLQGSDFFLRLLWTLDGPLALAYLAALGRLASRPLGRPQMEMLGLLLIPLLLYSISEAKMARAISVMCPWLGLAVGWAIQSLSGRARWLASALLLVAAASSGLQANRLPQTLRSAYPEALDFVLQRASLHLSSEAPISASLAGRRSVAWASLPRRALPQDQGELSSLRAQGADFLILDWEKYLWYNPLLRALESRLKPVLVLDNPCARFPALLHETYLPEDVERLRRTPSYDKILVYDLRAL